MPELTCSLTIGPEGSDTVTEGDQTATIPSGRFEMDWSFDEGAIGVLTSDNEDGGTFSDNTGTRVIRTQGTANYTLTVVKYGYKTASCSASATHQK